MKAKDKAKELVDRFKYRTIRGVEVETMSISLAKQCALIDTDNTIEALWNVGHSSCSDEIEYHREVKQEIEKL